MSGARITAAALVAIGLGVSACSQGGSAPVNRGICFDFRAKPAAPAATPAPAPAAGAAGLTPLPAADLSTPLDDCLRRWAYSLASSSDPADVVARAATGACEAHLERWNAQSLSSGATDQAPSISTGEPTNPLAAHAAWANDRALLHVVQARAGRCAPPRAKNGVPEGVPG